ncbi:MAG: BTAD domain-containing putative transcriptional regulator, partial [Gaiellaceae bacterium]
MSERLEFRVLGPLEVARDGLVLPLGRGRERALLALLLLRRNEVVTSDRLIEELWRDGQTRTAQTALQGYVARLRRLLGRERIVTDGSGYVLRVARAELDAERFELLLSEGRSADALALWRGPPFAEVRDEAFMHPEVGRLEELRLVALERHLERKVDSGPIAEAIVELELLVRQEPYRERLRFLLMLALYRAGRQAEALADYRELRRTFVEELGIEPSSEVRELERRILAQDPALAAQPATPPEHVAAPGREERKVTTVAYCDLVGSAALADRLDAEAFHALVERFVAACSDVIERHGGTVAGVSGDAVIGVFGMPRAYEDDALRAVRAASEIAEALVPLGLEARVGVATGEVMVGGRVSTPTGDAVNVAARLQAKTSPGDVLLDSATHARCRDAIEAGPVTVRVRGKPEPLTAFRLEAAAPGAAPFLRRLDVPLVGRERELADLRDGFERAVERRIPSVVALLGAPGLGKTRLAGELSTSLGSRGRVLACRCVARGENTVQGPLRELVV